MGPDGGETAPTGLGQLSCQLGVVLAAHIEEDVEPGQPGGQRDGVRARIVDAVREEDGPCLRRTGARQFLGGDLEREADVGEATSGEAEQCLHQRGRLDTFSEREQQCRVRPERDDRQLIVFHLAGQRTHRGCGRPDPLAAHRP